MTTYSLRNGLKELAQGVKNNKKLAAAYCIYAGATIALGELGARPTIDSLIGHGPYNVGGDAALYNRLKLARDVGVRIAEGAVVLAPIIKKGVDNLRKGRQK